MKNANWSKIAAVLLLAGGLNWGLIGFFGFNLVAALFGPLARVVYIAVGIAAVTKIFEKKEA